MNLRTHYGCVGEVNMYNMFDVLCNMSHSLHCEFISEVNNRLENTQTDTQTDGRGLLILAGLYILPHLSATHTHI